MDNCFGQWRQRSKGDVERPWSLTQKRFQRPYAAMVLTWVLFVSKWIHALCAKLSLLKANPNPSDGNKDVIKLPFVKQEYSLLSQCPILVSGGSAMPLYREFVGCYRRRTLTFKVGRSPTACTAHVQLTDLHHCNHQFYTCVRAYNSSRSYSPIPSKNEMCLQQPLR